MGGGRQLSAFIERIHEAAIDHSVWDTLLTDLSDHFSGNIAALYSPYLATGAADDMAWTVGMDDRLIKVYSEYYGPISTHFHILKTYPVGAIFTNRMAADNDIYEKSEAYNDLFKPLGAEHLLNVIPLRGGKRQTSLSFRRDHPYSDGDIAQLRHLTPHILQSSRISQHLRRVEGHRHGLSEALDLSREAILMLDGDGQLVFMNRRAHEVIAQRDGLSLDAEGAPRASVLSESTDLAAAIHAVAHGGKNGDWNAGEILSITRPSMRRPYQVLVAPLAGEKRVLDRHCAVILVVSDPESEPETSEQSLRRAYGLTTAEAKFVAVFVQEASLETTAARLSLTKSSARTYLKRIFTKTQVNSQVALIKLVLTGSLDRARR